MSQHVHVWALANYTPGQFVDVSDKAKMYQPTTSLWLCHCGVQKRVECTDLVATDKDMK